MKGERADVEGILQPFAPIDRSLEDGLRVRLRPIVPGDRARIHRAYEMLSEESRMNRFWERPRRLSEHHAERLVRVDGSDHLAWIALDPSDEGFPGFGGASFWREPDDPTSAEVALTIADAWQRRGLATLLFSILWFEGWSLGIRRFTGQCRKGNQAMVAWWAGVGGGVREEPRHWDLVLDLDSPAAFVERVGFDLRAGYRRIELGGWLRDWNSVTGEGSGFPR